MMIEFITIGNGSLILCDLSFGSSAPDVEVSVLAVWISTGFLDEDLSMGRYMDVVCGIQQHWRRGLFFEYRQNWSGLYYGDRVCTHNGVALSHDRISEVDRSLKGLYLMSSDDAVGALYGYFWSPHGSLRKHIRSGLGLRSFNFFLQ